MIASSALILWAGRGTGLTLDELAYFGRLIERSGEISAANSLDLEYLLIPHNGHLQLLGKLVYEGMFLVFGADYLGYRVVGLLGFLACIGLVFEFVRPRVGAALALVGAVLLLFLGAAWEVMIWAFDLHTTFAFAFGLGALLVLDRGGRRADPLACLLLVLSIVTIEVGLVAVVAVAVLVVARPDRLRRAWVFALPLVLYAVWWLWARQFGQGEFDLSGLSGLPGSIGESAAATFGSLAGRIDAGAEVSPYTVGINAWGVVLAVLAALALALRIRRRGGSVWLWALLAAVGTYWGLIALASGFPPAERPPDSSRYIFVGAALTILIAAEALRGIRIPAAAVIVACLAVAVALPQNVAKLFDGRSVQISFTEGTRAYFAGLELARSAVTSSDDTLPALERSGLDTRFVLAPATYFDAARRSGSAAISTAELRARDETVRAVADQALAAAYELALEPAEKPPDPSDCRLLEAAGGAAAFDLPPGGALVQATEGAAVLGAGRFVTSAPSVQLGELEQGAWARLAIPADPAPEPWRVFSTGPLRACAL